MCRTKKRPTTCPVSPVIRSVPHLDILVLVPDVLGYELDPLQGQLHLRADPEGRTVKLLLSPGAVSRSEMREIN